MFIYSLKASTVKLIAISLASVIALAALIAFVPEGSTTSPSTEYTTVTAISVDNNNLIKSGKIKNASDMNAFISSLGWTVEENPIEIVDVVIPSQFNNVYLKYNSIQKLQGLNLEKYKGKVAKRYTYVVTNYPNTTETVYLNMIIYKNKVIAGDVCSADINGFIHGLRYEDSSNS